VRSAAKQKQARTFAMTDFHTRSFAAMVQAVWLSRARLGPLMVSIPSSYRPASGRGAAMLKMAQVGRGC
jgi:hypothetical protein